MNPDAQIGSVYVGGDWTASSIAAGALGEGVALASVSLGNANDSKMYINQGVPAEFQDRDYVSSRIGSVTIVGQVKGTEGGTDHYGIVAENVGSVTISGTKVVLTDGNSNDTVALGTTGDFAIREI